MPGRSTYTPGRREGFPTHAKPIFFGGGGGGFSPGGILKNQPNPFIITAVPFWEQTAQGLEWFSSLKTGLLQGLQIVVDLATHHKKNKIRVVCQFNPSLHPHTRHQDSFIHLVVETLVHVVVEDVHVRAVLDVHGFQGDHALQPKVLALQARQKRNNREKHHTHARIYLISHKVDTFFFSSFFFNGRFCHFPA